MSFDVGLIQDGQLVEVRNHQEGGIYQMGGSNRAELNVTYNYANHFYAALDPDEGLRWLDGQRAGDTLQALSEAVVVLGKEQDANYWADTPGNAGYALSILLDWGLGYPDGIWSVT